MPRLMKDPEALRLYAIALLEAGREERSVSTIEKAVKLRPMDAGLLSARIKILARAGRYAQAVAECERALAINPKNTEALDTYVDSLRHLRRHDEATRAVELAQDKGAPADGHFARAFAEAAVGHPSDRVNPGEAIKVIERVFETQPAEHVRLANLDYTLASLLDKQGRYDEAFAALERGNGGVPVTFDAEAHRIATDDLIRAWTPEQLRPAADAPDDHHVFIVGMPRSGSTLAERILLANPGAASAGETNALPAVAHSLGIDNSAMGFVTNPAGIDRTQLPAAAKTYTKRVRAQAGAAPDEAVLDKLLINAFFIPLAAIMFPNARFIGCQRDPRDVGLSCYQQDFGNSHRAMYDLESIAHYQADVLRVMDRWAEVLPDRFTLIRYESVVADLDSAAREISAAAGLEFSERSLRFWESSDTIRTASYDQASRPVYTSSIGRWKNYEPHLGPMIRVLEERGVSLP